MKQKIKSVFHHSKDGLRIALVAAAIIVLCIIGLYSIEQIDHIVVRLDVVESRLDQMETMQQQQELLSLRGDIDDIQNLRLDQTGAEDLVQDFVLSSMLDYKVNDNCFTFLFSGS